MGNRAVIETPERNIGVYLHWDGGRDSVEGFLAYCDLKGFRPPENDCYGWARLCQVAGNYIGGSLSIGIDTCDRLDEKNWNNGVYVIEDWKIVDRLYFKGKEQMERPLLEMLRAINDAQPPSERILEPFLDPRVDDHIDPSDLKVGDLVLYSGDPSCSGVVIDKPYVDAYGRTTVPVLTPAYGEDKVSSQLIRRTVRAAV